VVIGAAQCVSSGGGDGRGLFHGVGDLVKGRGGLDVVVHWSR
jgi:hypothetical protein